MTFNYADFKRAWRERAAHYGVDPAQGANEYQEANIRADMAKTEKQRRAQPEPEEIEPGTGAWLRGWSDRPTDELRNAYGWTDDVSIGAIRHLLREAGRTASRLEPGGKESETIDPDQVGLQEFRDVWHEVMEELRADMAELDRARKAEIPLRMFGRYPSQYDAERLFELSLPERA